MGMHYPTAPYIDNQELQIGGAPRTAIASTADQAKKKPRGRAASSSGALNNSSSAIGAAPKSQAKGGDDSGKKSKSSGGESAKTDWKTEEVSLLEHAISPRGPLSLSLSP